MIFWNAISSRGCLEPKVLQALRNHPPTKQGKASKHKVEVVPPARRRSDKSLEAALCTDRVHSLASLGNCAKQGEASDDGEF